jgi:uncharacterized protein YeaO (DUF488 family)
MLKLKRAYDRPSSDDGARYFVERLWPRGIAKDDLALTGWLNELAPSTKLRQWYGHDPARLPEFVRRYDPELSLPEARAALDVLVEEGRSRDLTLVFATRNAEQSGGMVLKQIIEKRLCRKPKPK